MSIQNYKYSNFCTKAARQHGTAAGPRPHGRVRGRGRGRNDFGAAGHPR